MLNTLVHNLLIHEGSQWAVLNARDKHGPMQALVNGLIVYKGV